MCPLHLVFSVRRFCLPHLHSFFLIRCLCTLIRSPGAFSSPRLTAPAVPASAHMTDAPSELPCNHLLDFIQYVHLPLVLGSPELATTLQMQSHQWQVEGKGHSLDQLLMLSLMKPGRLLVSFALRMHYICCFILEKQQQLEQKKTCPVVSPLSRC